MKFSLYINIKLRLLEIHIVFLVYLTSVEVMMIDFKFVTARTLNSFFYHVCIHKMFHTLNINFVIVSNLLC